MEANVILSKCSKHKGMFGIRIEKREGDWVRTWAFKIDERKAKNEGFDKTPITGSLVADSNYPGCPHCGVVAFVCCGSCSKMSCLRSGGTSAHCYWCGIHMDNITLADSFNITSGEF